MEIVNGYVCRTCCDVDLAKRNIDPAHPKDGPYGQDRARDPAVTLGGRLAGRDVPGERRIPSAPGAALDLSA